MSFDLRSLYVGDIVRHSLTGEVVALTEDEVCLKDVRSGEEFSVPQADLLGAATDKIEMVKRAHRKPLVGQLISSRTLAATRWRRGTTFRNVDIPDWTLVVTPEGQLYAPQTGDVFEFEQLTAGNVHDVVWSVIFLP